MDLAPSLDRQGDHGRIGLDAWNAVVASTFDNLVVDADREAFEGAIDVRDLGGMDLSRVASSAAVVRRGRSSLAQRPYFKLHVQDVGRSLNLQDGREAVLDEGDLMLCDPARPYTIRFDDPNRMLVLRIPSERLADRMADPEALCGRRLAGDGLAGALLTSFIRTLWVNAGRGAAPVGEAVQEAALSLLSAVAQESDGSARVARELEAGQGAGGRIKRFIDENLCDPDLSVGRVAEALGVSPRYVQMVFAGMATTPLAYIRRKRLERAAKALRDAGGACNITDLSFGLGFNDLSHFSRAFKAFYGVGPREFRAS
jgi:AraC-like DNA-binding protein